jgi:osmotically-inducible protein OsmY
MNIINQFNAKFFGAAFLAAVLLATIVGCASTAKHSSTGEYIDDTVITTKVKAAILDDKDLKVTEINVETFKGVVQLSGFVNSQGDINKAANVARNVKGVKSVKNDMRVK